MSVTNIIEVALNNRRTVEVKDSLFQYDYGQILKITDLQEMGILSPYQVYFSNDLKTGVAKPQMGDANGVKIPDEYLQTGKPVYAFFYLHHGESDGRTVHVVKIPVISRVAPLDEVPTEVEQSALNQAIAAIQSAAETLGMSEELIEEKVYAATGRILEGYLENDELGALEIQDGTLAREKVDSDFEATLEKADNSWQKNTSQTVDPTEGSWEATYDPQGYNRDIFSFILSQDTGVISRIKGTSASDNLTFTFNDRATPPVPHSYTGIDNAFQGVYNFATNYAVSYIDGKFTNYSPIQIRVVTEEELAALMEGFGEANTFYLTARESSSGYFNYDKYWYVNGTWDTFGSSSTVVVASLNEVDEPSEEADYIVGADGDFQYYKYIDDNWELIAGNNADTITTNYIVDFYGTTAPSVEIASTGQHYVNTTTLVPYESVEDEGIYSWSAMTALVANPTTTKDYFIQFGSSSPYLHFRYNGTTFVQVGSTAYSRDETDALIATVNNRITTNTNNIESNATNISLLNRSIDRLAQDISELDVEGATYNLTLTTEDNQTYTVTLIETEDGEDTIKSQFNLPSNIGGGGSSSTTTLVVDRITPSPVICTPTDSVIITIDYSSTDSDNQSVDGSYTIKSGGSTVASGGLVQGRNSFDITEYCSVGTQKFILTVTDEGGSVNVKSWTVQVVDVRLETGFSDRYTVNVGQSVNYTYTPYGAVSKTVHFKLGGTDLESVVTQSSGTLQSYTLSAQTHGAHLLESWITATVNNTQIETQHIFKDIIWYDETSSIPVIGCIYRYDYYGKVAGKQYNTIAIPYNVFDPNTNYPVVKRYVDGDLIATDTLTSSNAVWNFKSSDVGDHTLLITCGVTTVTIIVNVAELDIDVDPITGGLEIDFNPVGITNNSDNRLWSNANYHMSVSQNFDWANGGYQIDENGDPYFMVKAGTRATFDYKMFAGGLNANPSITGAEMKIMFMTENVQDANATWFSNVETTTTEIDGETTTTNVGIQLNVHEGWLKTNNASDSDVENGEGENTETVAATNTYLYVPYSEEDIIEMDINIDTLDRENESAQAFVMSYEDGVPSKAYVYDSGDRFYQYDPKDITIGSDYCDVRIYRLKVYSVSLSTNDIMRNFIADSRDSDTMIARYNRNCIYYDREHNRYTPYSSEGILDPERLATVVPNVKILMLDTDHFTTSKKTFVKSTLRCIHASGGDVYPGDPFYDNWKAENMYHSGQGTTSDNYGNAGRNVDFLFNCDGTHKPSDKVDAEAGYVSRVTIGYNTENAVTETVTDWKGSSGKVALTRTSVPNNFFNLKVNIASSENVNNALLQKRYNDYLPYISPAKRRDSKIKNDMEFVPAILFIRENNPDISTHNEFLDTEWHYYALGNIGDSKKTDYTRSYDPQDMNEFTIEISDNTKNNSTFQTGIEDLGNGSYRMETFKIVKTLDEKGKLIKTPVAYTPVTNHIQHIPASIVATHWNTTGTITVENETGDPQYDGNEIGFLNMRKWCLENEDFDGDHSFEPRYACCGDYRDGKLVNDTTGNGKAQVKINNKVWRAFYEWVITVTDEQFVDELDQWCVRSAVEFFYAFTHIYTMMDNRAKNTFWHFAKTGTYREVSRPVKDLLHIYCEYDENTQTYFPTEDTSIDNTKTYYTQYAFDLWCYDTDTGLGINNNGELVFPYGKEDTDYNIDGNPSSGYVFNGATSVFWCRLRDLLQSEIRNTFSNVVAADCFSATSLINQFDQFQSCYPEEIWRLDIQRKYIRTFTGESIDNSKPKHDVQYLRDMMQGKKKYQRRQWIRDQEIYFGTKNLMNTVVGDDNRITFRCFTPTGNDIVVSPDYTLKITPYSDMYLSVMFGNGGTQQVRAKAGVEYTIECPLSTMDDTQVTIYGANRIQALSDLSACYIAANNFSMATKLRKLVLGNTTEGYNNSRLVSLTLGRNKLLEELDLRNCGNLTGSINLSQCNNLLKLYAEGTKLSGVTFATNGKVRIAHLPDTINTLTMRNLNDMTDFQATLNRLETLTLQGGTLNSYNIVSGSINTLQVLYLYEIDWSVVNTNLLNAIYNMFYSLLTGSVYISGQIRSQELVNYHNKWSDLTVTYNNNNLVVQYPVTYVNADDNHTVLYQTYIDQGSLPIDPYELGLISKPQLESTAEYNYSFGTETDGEYDSGSGWTGLTNPVLSATTITAVYTPTIRKYTVRWYDVEGGTQEYILTNIEYGSEAIYGGAIPTRTDGESQYQFHIFKGWDKSTGCVRSDLNVYGLWDDAPTLPPPPIDNVPVVPMNEMTPAQIYGIGQAGYQGRYWNPGDYIDITLGHDFDFENVESIEIGKDVMLTGIQRDTFVSGGYYFDGSHAFTTDIKLFAADSPSFTMAIDFQMNSGNVGTPTLVSTHDGDNAEGFRIYYSGNYVKLQWGDNNINIGYQTQRDIVVIRHKKGDKRLIIYGAGNNSTGRFATEITVTPSLRSNTTTTDEPLTFGGTRYGNQYLYGKGTLHWCKIWFDDLGENVAKQIAVYPREKIRMEYWGAGRYYYDNSITPCKASWICNHLLDGIGGRGYWMNPTNTNVGGWDSSAMRALCNGRIFDAFPTVWQSIIKTVKINATKGSQSSGITTSIDKIYLPSSLEIGEVLRGAYANEFGTSNSPVPWFTSNTQRVKFKGKVRKYIEEATVYECAQEPAALYQTNIEPGSIWFNTSNSNYAYIFVSQAELSQYGKTPSIAADSNYASGGWVIALGWWERSPSVSNSTSFLYVDSTGGTGSGGYGASSARAVAPGFSI